MNKETGEVYKFPKKFMWGAATSAIQVEGNVINSDWWEWEQAVQPVNFRSGLACDHYNRFREDFELAKELGLNAQRIGIEWSRIEPEEGKFDQTEIDHYREVVETIKSLGMSVCLTLHHFSNPSWFAKKGGWHNLKSPYYFERFVSTVVPAYKDYVDLWITINEPTVYIGSVYIDRVFPGSQKSTTNLLKTYFNFVRAHRKAYRAIHEDNPNAKVGIANNVSSFDVFHHHVLREILREWISDTASNHLFYKLSGKTHDFLGINYYMHHYIDYKRPTDWTKIVDVKDIKEVSDLGWEINPEGMFDVLTDLSDYGLPIYITENGIATKNDERRVRFLISYLLNIYHAISAGADVRGYFHWTLLDNMELHRGYDPKFGLIEVDFKTLKRTPKPSSYVYRDIAKRNGIDHKLLKLLGHGVDVSEVLGSTDEH